MLLTERQAIEQALEQIVAGNTAQMNDPAFVNELTDWIRFNHGEAVRSGDGLYSGATGNPNVPRWIGRAFMKLFFSTDSENALRAAGAQRRGARGVRCERAAPAHRSRWAAATNASRCRRRPRRPERLPESAGRGGRSARSVRVVAGDDGRRPDLVLRFGYGPKMPVSLRRPVDAVLTSA